MSDWIGLLEQVLDDIDSVLDDKSVPMDVWSKLSKIHHQVTDIVDEANGIL